ncbi:polynucleotide adenylyltransferase PcnB [Gayadomonas joobiniege]|uniref:polynucleotide adenylyltransferase PcnB n=1 Tax=Gayadomonas joobiniege TaxID=1234606 RepID=UPI0009DB3622|nr:polynucleotide adenylyltransferase PcnB [Gayadomonas joobiniege]
MCKKALGKSSERPQLRIIPRSEHNISRKNLSKNALRVLYGLKDAGYEAYLVGGGVRDILLGLAPKDFDIVTNATPEEIKKTFRNCRLIGRRFRLAHIVFGPEIIEVATFRGHHSEDSAGKNQSDHGQLLSDNVYGSIDEDAERRDFSANALYYNIADFSIYDYWGGVEAIEQRNLDLIGDPETRYREDPVRMLRAVRFAVKLEMQISERTAKPIKSLAPLLQNIPKARLFEECLKLLLSGQGLETYKMLMFYQLFQQIFPNLPELDNDKSATSRLFEQALKNTDLRLKQGLRITPAFIFAVLLWYQYQEAFAHYQQQALPDQDAAHLAISAVLDSGAYNVVIPKRFATTIREIWILQLRLQFSRGNKALKTLEHPRFRAAYDFLLLRAEVEPDLTELANWWTQVQKDNPTVKPAQAEQPKRRPRRRRRPAGKNVKTE